MKFFHVYREDWLEGLEKNGLLNDDSAFKLQHDYPIPKKYLFNEYAAVGTPLYHFIKDNHIPFYVDRLAGGTTYMPSYKMDLALVEEYRNILGDDFLGFQLHESASNRRNSDWAKILRVTGKKSGFDPQFLRENLISPHAVTAEGEKLVSFSQGTPEYYAKLKYAETVKEFIEEIRALFSWRMEDTNNNILPVDSYFLFTKMQDELGMHTFMPEVGCQIPLMRQAVALARGTARAKNKKWGTYYECWRADRGEDGKIGYCMPCFSTDHFNEWYLTQDLFGDDFTTHGANGGSSRLLQERIYFHTLMSGADYFGEEWGFRCSYYDTKDYALTPYGEVKKEFINTAAGIHGVEAKTPIALVLPLDYACVEIPETFDERCYIGTRRGKYMSVALTEAESEYYGHIEDLLTLLFNRVPDEAFGNEGHTLANGRFGDVFDIIYEDATDEQLARYDYLIDATADGRFAKAKNGMAHKILSGADIGKLTAELDRVIPETMPVYVDALHWLVSTDDKGRRFLTIFNNEGNMRTSAKGDVINRDCDKRVKITLKDGALGVFKAAREDIHLEKADDKTYYATIAAADFVIFTF